MLKLHYTIITIAPSAKQQGVIWVGTDDGNVQLTQDGGKTWTNFRGKIAGMPLGAWIPQIHASRHNAGEAFVVANDYRREISNLIFSVQLILEKHGQEWSMKIK